MDKTRHALSPATLTASTFTLRFGRLAIKNALDVLEVADECNDALLHRGIFKLDEKLLFLLDQRVGEFIQSRFGTEVLSAACPILGSYRLPCSQAYHRRCWTGPGRRNPLCGQVVLGVLFKRAASAPGLYLAAKEMPFEQPEHSAGAARLAVGNDSSGSL